MLLFTNAIPILYAKYNDLQHLKMFCGKEARDFYSNLPKTEPGQKKPKKTGKNEESK